LVKEPTVTNIIIAVLTRKTAADITPSAPSLSEDIEIASDIHAQCTETESNAASNLSKESFLETTRNIVLTLPRNIARAAF
jgi:hypothetical protein